jgi:RNA polymerase primary sigma factor
MTSKLSSLFAFAISTGNEVAVEAILKLGADVNARDAGGHTPLILAAKRGNLSLCLKFLSKGADPAAVNSRGQAASDLARAAGHSLISDMLDRTLARLSSDGSTDENAIAAPSDLSDNSSIGETHAPNDIPPEVKEAPTSFDPDDDWEAIEPAAVEVQNGDVIADAEDLQRNLSDHAGINTGEIWDDVQISLPSAHSFEDCGFEFSYDEQLHLLGLFDKGLRWGYLSTGELHGTPARFADVARDVGIQVVRLPQGYPRGTPEIPKRYVDLLEDDSDHPAKDALLMLEELVASDVQSKRSELFEEVYRRTPMVLWEEREMFEKYRNSARELSFELARSVVVLQLVSDLCATVASGQTPLRTISNLDEELEQPASTSDEDNDEPDVAGPTLPAAFLHSAEKISSVLEAGRPRTRTNAQVRETARWIEDLELTQDILQRMAYALEDSGHTETSTLILKQLRTATSIRDKLILSELPYVHLFAEKARCLSMEVSDLVSEGVIGLMKAVELFDPARGYRFHTYAQFWIRQSINRAVCDKDPQIRIPVHKVEQLAKIRQVRRKLRKTFSWVPSADEIAEAAETTIETLVKNARIPRKPLSLEIATSKEQELYSFHATRFLSQSASPDETVTLNQLKEEIRSALLTLPPRQEQIIRLRFGIDLDSDKTLEEIGQLQNVTRERIRQIEAKALKALKHPSRARALRKFRDD